jgi:hypothetical protein
MSPKVQSVKFSHDFGYPGFEYEGGYKFVSGVDSHGSTVDELWENSSVSVSDSRGNELNTHRWTASDVSDDGFEAELNRLFAEALAEAVPID